MRVKLSLKGLSLFSGNGLPVRRRWFLGLVALLMISGFSISFLFGGGEAEESFAKAEKYFLEKSFAKALNSYKTTLKRGGENYAKRNFVRLRIAECQHTLG